MKRYLIIVFLLCLAVSGFADSDNAAGSEKNISITINDSSQPNSGQDYLAAVHHKLNILEQNFLAKLNKSDQRDAEKLLNEIRGLVSLLVEQNQNTGGNTTINIDLGNQNSIHPMEDSSFRELKKSVIASIYGDTSIKVLTRAAEENFFSVSQILEILQLLTFSDDKVEALRVLYPRCADPENKFKLMNAFLFDSDRDLAAEIIEG
jgi:hypothetical protein